MYQRYSTLSTLFFQATHGLKWSQSCHSKKKPLELQMYIVALKFTPGLSSYSSVIPHMICVAYSFDGDPNNA